MQDFGSLNDAYIWGLTEQGFEPEVVHQCKCCNDDLYEGQEAVIDDEGNYFCDFSCAREFHEIKDTFEVEEEFCEHCGDYILAEFEFYVDKEKNYFCCCDCADEYRKLRYTTLERNEG